MTNQKSQLVPEPQGSLLLYEVACDKLARTFVHKYFGKGAEQWWVGDIKGEVLYVNDRFFSMDDIANFIRYKYSAKMLFSYYDEKLERLECGKDWVYSIYSYKKLKK
jgi:hypothetical protein